MLGAIAGGLAADFASTAYANRLNTKAAHSAQDFSAQSYASRYQTQVRDLKAAGLNPMLAYSQSPGGGPSGVMAPQKGPESFRAVNESKLASAQAAKIEQETSNLRLEADNLSAIYDRLQNEIVKVGNEVHEVDQRIRSGQASEAETRKRTELIDRQKELTEMQIQLSKQEKIIKTPEEIASSTQGAQNAAHIQRTLAPLLDAINAALQNVNTKPTPKGGGVTINNNIPRFK